MRKTTLLLTMLFLGLFGTVHAADDGIIQWFFGTSTAQMTAYDTSAYMPVNLMRVNSQQYIEGTYTPLAWLRLIGASLFGDVENSGTTYYFRDVADSKARITIDLSGSNRNTTALDGD